MIYIYYNGTFSMLNWKSVASRRKMHKCIPVYKYLIIWYQSTLLSTLLEIELCMIIRLGEGMTCTHQNLNAR